MLPFRNIEIYTSIIFFLVTKIFCSLITWYRSMYKHTDSTSKRPTLTSIPERCENEEDLSEKWVPKKKHEVLKAKYKCLKKLFQVYDASVIGILPEANGPDVYLDDEIQTKKRRKKRSHRTKSDACAGTNELFTGDTTHSISDDTEKGSTIATALIKDLKIKQESCTSTQVDACLAKDLKVVATQDSRINIENCPAIQDAEATQTYEEQQPHQQQHQQQQQQQQQQPPHPVPYLVLNEKRRLTRFQCFIHRILGIRGDQGYSNYMMSNSHMYASSDNNIPHNCNYNFSEKRRRRGLRFRKLKRPKKIKSESALRDMDSSTIMTCMQSIQRSCLMDTTQRKCPIVGCHMITNGIINYNDHLVLSHFPERKYICLYCHEGFTTEFDKVVHENEHIGLMKLGHTASVGRQSSRRTARPTQTETEVSNQNPPEDKYKKIVSFLEQMDDPGQILSEIKKNRYSESNLQQSHTETESGGYTTDSTDKQTVSCVNLNKKVERKYSADSDLTLKHPRNSAVVCHLCGESFNYRRQLNLHLELDHGQDKFMKFHNSTGLLNTRSSNYVDLVSEDGKINVQSIDRSHSGIGRVNTSTTLSSYTEISRRKSEESLNFDPATNIVYYTSMESVEQPPPPTKLGHKARACNSYKWEPGTKIIHV